MRALDLIVILLMLPVAVAQPLIEVTYTVGSDGSIELDALRAMDSIFETPIEPGDLVVTWSGHDVRGRMVSSVRQPISFSGFYDDDSGGAQVTDTLVTMNTKVPVAADTRTIIGLTTSDQVTIDLKTMICEGRCPSCREVIDVSCTEALSGAATAEPERRTRDIDPIWIVNGMLGAIIVGLCAFLIITIHRRR